MRLLLVVLFMTLATGLRAQESQGVSEESPTQKEKNQGDKQHSHPSADQFPLPVWIIEDPSEAQRTRDREAASDKHEADDLKAQERAADAAVESAASAKRQENLAKWQIGLSVAGVFALLVTIIYSIKATNAATNAVAIAKDELRWANPPRIRARRFSVEHKTPEMPIDGRFYFANTGNHNAVFVGVWCVAEWRTDELSMQPAYENKYVHGYGGDSLMDESSAYFKVASGDVIKPGQWHRVLFRNPIREHPLGEGARLYVHGWVDFSYEGEANRRRTAFGRVFDPKCKSRPWFQKHENADYDFED